MAQVTASQAARDLEIAIRIGNAVMIIGAYGVGKSDIVRQVAAKLGLPVIDKRASQMAAIDTRLPMPDAATGLIKDFLPDWLPRVERDGPAGLLFLDELSNASLAVQAALYQLILDRCLGDYVLPHGWHIVAAGNTMADRSAAQKFSRALANRFTIVEIVPDVASWLIWAIGAGVAPEIVAYVTTCNNASQAQGLAAIFDGGDHATSDAIAILRPRSLARAAKLLDPSLGLSDAELRRNLAHNVGETWSDGFMAFLASWRLLPDLNAILADPLNAPVNREPSVNYALTVALVSRATMANLASVVAYVNRLDPLYRASFWSMATSKNASFRDTPEHIAHLIAQSNTGI